MENTKDFIIREAFRLFLHRGYQAVSINDISIAVGLTKGALYHHFKNKEELFRSIVDRYLLLPEVDVEVETLSLSEYIQITFEKTEKFFKTLFDVSQVFSSINHLAFFADALRYYPGYAEAKDLHIASEIEKTRVVLQHAIRTGEIRDDINLDVITNNFFAINLCLAGNMVRQNTLEKGIAMLKDQTKEFYKLLKKP
jgi:AcrR family transcriptional regulator